MKRSQLIATIQRELSRQLCKPQVVGACLHVVILPRHEGVHCGVVVTYLSHSCSQVNDEGVRWTVQAVMAFDDAARRGCQGSGPSVGDEAGCIMQSGQGGMVERGSEYCCNGE